MKLSQEQKLKVRDAQYLVYNLGRQLQESSVNLTNVVSSICKDIGLSPEKVTFNLDTLEFSEKSVSVQEP